MEHHSNIIPWQILSKEKNIKIKFIPILDNGHLDLEKIKNLITSKTKLISITHMSNVLGVINPIEKIISERITTCSTGTITWDSFLQDIPSQ